MVKGIVNRALLGRGQAPISRYCEVPEFKHACLGGLYGIKNAARFLACENDPNSLAVVISSDVPNTPVAAATMPLRLVSGWREAATKIGFANALQDATDLSRQQYESLHDTAWLNN